MPQGKDLDAVAQRIFDLADAKYDEQKDFASAIGETPSIVSQWRNGISKSYRGRLSKIAEALGTTTDYLLTGTSVAAIGTAGTLGIAGAMLGGPLGAATGLMTGALGAFASEAINPKKAGSVKIVPTTKTEKNKPQQSLLNDAQPLDLGTFRRIPILGRISAGLPLYAEQHIEGYTVTDLNGGVEYFALIVHGDPMDALGIKDGYRIIVRRQEEVENGEVAVVMVGQNDATVKRFYASGSAVTLVPQSTNPEHQPQFYDTTKTPVKVIGKVVKVEFTL